MGIPTVPKIRIIAINGSAGAYVLISSSIFAGYAEIQECAPGGGVFDDTNYAPQGLNISLPDDKYVNVFPLNPGEIFSIGDAYQKNRSIGTPKLTYPDGSSQTPPYAKVRSATATTTQIEIREWPQNARQ